LIEIVFTLCENDFISLKNLKYDWCTTMLLQRSFNNCPRHFIAAGEFTNN